MEEQSEKANLIDMEENPAPYYEPAPPPDYFTVMNMDEYGAPQYIDPTVQGFQQVDPSQAAQQPGLPRLAYADFLPYCFRPGNPDTGKKPVFDSFRGLFAFANTWLSQNRHYSMLQIESIESRVGLDGREVEDGKTIEHTSVFGANGLLRGIRLWLVPSSDPTGPPQRLGFFNWLPEEDPIEQEVWISQRAGMMRGVMTTKHVISYPNFKDLTHTLQNLNDCLQKNPLPGTVKAVQTMELLFQEMWGAKCFDPDKSCVFYQGLKPKLFLNYLRVFYIEGPSTPQTIDLMDFVPEVEYMGASFGKPRMEEFKQVFQRASAWVYQNDAKSVRALNIQTVPMKTSAITMRRCTAGDTIVNPKITWYQESGETVFVKTIRVACMRLNTPEDRLPLILTSRLFLPVRTAMKTAETIPQTVARINAWLDLTGVPVTSVTTEKFIFEPEAIQPVKPERSLYSVHVTRGIYMMTALRVFLWGEFKEPDPAQLRPAEEYTRKSSSCTIF